ncbi:MAG: efflux RND transporter periplasmic adaptor subunit [Verrucomicrobia bacterium]|nr:efflux RND transporter periplasmic adaptor subunit [Verrucomicrobiota bacterium]
MLPSVLVLAFGAVIAWAFADRLFPAREVTVTPTILLSDIEQEATDASSHTASPTRPAVDYSATMLFQAAGWFEPDPLPIRAPALVDGVVDEVFVLEGETVKKGQPLASLIPDDTQLLVDGSRRKLEQTIAEHHMNLANIPAVQAEAASVFDQIKSAEASLAEVSDKFSRLGGLSKGTVSDQEITAARLAVDSQTAKIAALKSDHAAVLARLDAIKAQSKVFDAMIAAAEVELSVSELALARTKVVSPVDGVVLELKAAPGQKKLLPMDDPDSATVAVLFEPGKLQARVDVPLADARQLAQGQAAIITSDFLPNAEFKGVVSRIVGTADLQRNTLQAKVRVIDPDERLRPEMLCRVKFLDNVKASQAIARSPTSDGSRSVMAPIEGLIDRDGSNANAWVVSPDGSRALRRGVELGSLEIDGYVAVRSGLLAGERLILPPHDGLEKGRRIEPKEAKP